MTQESIAKKLSELFELHKSGAITKEEFDRLKKQILSEDGLVNIEDVNKKEAETIKTPVTPIPLKRGNKIWVFAIIGVVLIVAAFLVLRTNCGGVAKDQDGNRFKTVNIGNQVWMAENLRVMTFSNGEPIEESKTTEEWEKARKEQKPSWCYSNNDPANGKVYGKLYNRFAVNDSRGLAPKGWHVPSDEEWTTLTTYLGGEDVAGGKLKEIGTAHWLTPNTGATNETGFTALPGGTRPVPSGALGFIGDDGYWWSSTKDFNTPVWSRSMSSSHASVGRNSDNGRGGFSVRCVKDGKVEVLKEETVLKDSNPSKSLKEFFNSYMKQDTQTEKNINPEIGIFLLTNPGSRCISEKTKSIKFIEITIPEENVFDRRPKGDMCGGYPGEKDGFYYQIIRKDKLPSFVDYVNDNEVFRNVELPQRYSNSKLIEVTIVQNESWKAIFYFVQIDGSWYIFCQSFCDCSA